MPSRFSGASFHHQLVEHVSGVTHQSITEHHATSYKIITAPSIFPDCLKKHVTKEFSNSLMSYGFSNSCFDDHCVLCLCVRGFGNRYFRVGVQFLADWVLWARIILFDPDIANYHRLVYYFR